MWKKLTNRSKDVSGEISPAEFKSRPYEIEPLNFHSLAPPKVPPHRHTKQNSEATSSVYSQQPQFSPNAGATLTAPWNDQYHDQYHEVSPPNSAGGDMAGDGPVSPIDEPLAHAVQLDRPSPKHGSHIPRPQKPSGGTKWDEYSGEPTHKASGRAGQFTPGNPYYNPGDGENVPPTDSRVANQQKKNTLAERAARFAPKKLTKGAEPWSRVIGRTTFVDPVRDTPQIQKLPVPPRNPKRTNAATSSAAGPPANDNTSSSQAGESHNNNNSSRARQQYEDTMAALTAPRPFDASDREHPGSRFSWSTHATGTTHRTSTSNDNYSPDTPPPMPTNMPSLFTKGLSRKQSTDSPTSASSATGKRRLPVPPSQFPLSALSAKQESVLDRKRPIPKDDVPNTPRFEDSASVKSTTSSARKPVAAPLPTARHLAGLGISTTAPPVKPAHGSVSPDTASISSSNEPKSKALPRAPSILASTREAPVDHVATLRAQLDDIAHHRININRAIHNMTKAASERQNPLVTDWRTARESERKVQSLKDELAELAREEHDVGLKLHRAYKRRERAGEWEGTSALWVRRVTG